MSYCLSPIVAAKNAVSAPTPATTVLEKGASAVALGKSAILNPDWATGATEPGYAPRRPPVSLAELRERGLNQTFAEYMKAWKGFVEG